LKIHGWPPVQRRAPRAETTAVIEPSEAIPESSVRRVAPTDRDSQIRAMESP
jgi:hypothetical protein